MIPVCHTPLLRRLTGLQKTAPCSALTLKQFWPEITACVLAKLWSGNSTAAANCPHCMESLGLRSSRSRRRAIAESGPNHGSSWLLAVRSSSMRRSPEPSESSASKICRTHDRTVSGSSSTSVISRSPSVLCGWTLRELIPASRFPRLGCSLEVVAWLIASVPSDLVSGPPSLACFLDLSPIRATLIVL